MGNFYYIHLYQLFQEFIFFSGEETQQFSLSPDHVAEAQRSDSWSGPAEIAALFSERITVESVLRTDFYQVGAAGPFVV
jgi:hypothetical protein